MSNLEDNTNKNILNINYLNQKDLLIFTNDKLKILFNWRKYINEYPDLKADINIHNSNDAWQHWKNHGIKEQRIFFLNKKKENNISDTKHIKEKQQVVQPIIQKSIIKIPLNNIDETQNEQNEQNEQIKTNNNKKMVNFVE